MVVYSPVFCYSKSYSLDICKSICKRYNIPFFDYSEDRDFLTDNKIYEDPEHLNKDGAKRFTNKLLKTIKKRMS
jgi:lysophospholipase L1-like esterase